MAAELRWEGRCVGPGLPIRDTSCWCHPLTAFPYLRFGPRRSALDCGLLDAKVTQLADGCLLEATATFPQPRIVQAAEPRGELVAGRSAPTADRDKEGVDLLSVGRRQGWSDGSWGQSAPPLPWRSLASSECWSGGPAAAPGARSPSHIGCTSLRVELAS